MYKKLLCILVLSALCLGGCKYVDPNADPYIGDFPPVNEVQNNIDYEVV